MPFTPGKWLSRSLALLGDYPASSAEWRAADAVTIRGAMMGVSPYTGNRRKDGGAKVVFNISSAHVPAFAHSKAIPAYENRYDHQRRIGEVPPLAEPDARERLDRMLASLFGFDAGWDSIYYGAVELNGSGVRYYGDVCLVLKDAEVLPDTRILNRNSFDLICEPLRSRTHGDGVWHPVRAEVEADNIAGLWSELGDVAVCRVLRPGATDDRRITIGTISESILADEDYVEVIRDASFTVRDLGEARVAASDAAVDGLISDRLRRGPLPDWSELIWRHRRRKADEALRAHGVSARVVASPGRRRT